MCEIGDFRLADHKTALEPRRLADAPLPPDRRQPGSNPPERIVAYGGLCSSWSPNGVLRRSVLVSPVHVNLPDNTLRCVCHGQCTYVISAASLDVSPPYRRLSRGQRD